MKRRSVITNDKITDKNNSYFTMKKSDYLYSLFSAIICIFFVIFSLWGSFKIGFSATYIMLFSLLTVFLYDKKTKPSIFSLICGVLSLILSLVFGYTANYGIKYFSSILIVISGGVWFLSLSGKFSEQNEVDIVTKVFTRLFGKTFGAMGKTMGSLFNNENNKIKKLLKALIGVACAIPLILIILPLLSSADMAFEGIIEKIGGVFFKRMLQIIIGLIIAPFIISYGISLKKDDEKEPVKKELKTIENAYLASFLSVLSVVYIVYLFSQLAYFFDAFKGILPGEFTLAEYARRGFFEMCVIAGINFAVAFIALLLSYKKDGKPSKIVSVLCTFISLFTIILISTALAKMILYIKNYGMTVLRITTSGFMLFLFVVFIALILRCFCKKTKVVRVALISAMLILMLLGFLNVEGTVAKYNVNAYMKGNLKTIDINMIEDLGLEGVPALYYITENVNDYNYQKKAREALRKINLYYNTSDRETGDWCYTEHQARKILDNMF